MRRDIREPTRKLVILNRVTHKRVIHSLGILRLAIHKLRCLMASRPTGNLPTGSPRTARLLTGSLGIRKLLTANPLIRNLGRLGNKHPQARILGIKVLPVRNTRWALQPWRRQS